MEIIPFFNTVFSLGTIIAQIFIFAAILYLLFFRKKSGQPLFLKQFFELIGKRGILLAFITALIATLGSLFYSNVAGFPPCDLCWFQRIFMYPLVILFAVALIKKDSSVIKFALPTALIGGIISLYHNYMYFGDQGLNAICQLFGVGVSCTKRYVFEFGYITIPMMALTAFALILVFLVLVKKYEELGK